MFLPVSGALLCRPAANLTDGLAEAVSGLFLAVSGWIDPGTSYVLGQTGWPTRE